MYLVFSNKCFTVMTIILLTKTLTVKCNLILLQRNNSFKKFFNMCTSFLHVQIWNLYEKKIYIYVCGNKYT